MKCSWYGQDPYWGRVASELGTAGITFEPDKLTVRYGDLVVAEGGVTAPVDEQALAAYMAQEHLEVTAHLGLGRRHRPHPHQRPHPRLRRREHGHLVRGLR